MSKPGGQDKSETPTSHTISDPRGGPYKQGVSSVDTVRDAHWQLAARTASSAVTHAGQAPQRSVTTATAGRIVRRMTTQSAHCCGSDQPSPGVRPLRAPPGDGGPLPQGRAEPVDPRWCRISQFQDHATLPAAALSLARAARRGRADFGELIRRSARQQ
jgi:hypothetical protein